VKETLMNNKKKRYVKDENVHARALTPYDLPLALLSDASAGTIS
jgi:hypothetical protein